MKWRVVAVLVVLCTVTEAHKFDTALGSGSARKLLQGSSAVTPQQTVKSKCTTTKATDAANTAMAAAGNPVATKSGAALAPTTTKAGNTMKPAAAAQQAGTTARPASKPTQKAPSAAMTYRPISVIGPTPRSEERFKIGDEALRGMGK
ncbi:hypothetical protein OEZ85_012108 [Tetradesmus obliquus]|uniref:Secreted protein n=1 Tax=Tetradesmus obliquus TaxID=3088 RepID=A0ABY8TSB8_TETOB|nr:hypothetical protein OEZ85_012108 [Tetradesmus obliquus]